MADQARGQDSHARLVDAGVRWLTERQNEDGGWGDTNLSLSNISTTMLCIAALTHASHSGDSAVLRHAWRWVRHEAGGDTIRRIAKALSARYGADGTFRIPILSACAIAGVFAKDDDAWSTIGQLPFELAAVPQRWFRFVNLQVVSYALPALIAVGLLRHHRRPTRNPVLRVLRESARPGVLRLLERIQPTSGGFLEAAPLTSFVVMSLAAIDLAEHPAARRGVEFLINTVREDGSWPIDTNLSTWLTTLSVNALSCSGKLTEYLDESERTCIRSWLLDQQYNEMHPYTGADPGGWAWTDLSGGVPDADDTPGGVLALGRLAGGEMQDADARLAGLNWLMGLQNRDGGIPTFCRGWGRLPFDRSSVDLTAHFLRAAASVNAADERFHRRLNRAVDRAYRFLISSANDDGSWTPLWFGNQFAADDANLVYGTSRVIIGLAFGPTIATGEESSLVEAAFGRGTQWLLAAQNRDGGWGGATGIESSIEETGVALDALGSIRRSKSNRLGEDDRALVGGAQSRGLAWLIERTNLGRNFEPTPIGFYFARLWYYERLYPIIFSVAALEGSRPA
jgi:squalene-hopene/tetraprenyl-beta-curcumene cyclase